MTLFRDHRFPLSSWSMPPGMSISGLSRRNSHHVATEPSFHMPSLQIYSFSRCTKASSSADMDSKPANLCEPWCAEDDAVAYGPFEPRGPTLETR